jgi:hypothetical protein
LIQYRKVTKREMRIFVEIFAILSRASVLLPDFRFAGMATYDGLAKWGQLVGVVIINMDMLPGQSQEVHV